MTTHGGRRGEPRAADGTGQPDLAPVPAATRGGEDARRRGWFWHWNSLVTQYAPLIGLKGVGLLNSYTVWTDRREESPHRGYAFPSQQSEADFYGEDRAELITINKILVALDLIEIRKEMVLRADAQGRRWKVPHNFYRVKDHDDDFALSAGDVLRVATLAERDKAVYRYVRRVFSPRFAPIDGDNPWHRILPEVRQTPLWQTLAARAAAEEGRASARTRAGHAARKTTDGTAGAALAVPVDGPFFVPGGGDTTAGERVDSATGTVATPEGDETSVASINDGLEPDVAGTNRGSERSRPTSVGAPNRGTATAVDRTNTTYYQNDSTTTTGAQETKMAVPNEAPARREPGDGDAESRQVLGATSPMRGVAGGPGEPPGDAAGEAAAVRAFQEANDRTATPAERKLLAGLAERFDPEAAANGASGWAWVAAAVYEAVEAGSAFVAPRRLREIMGRWEREGYPQDGDDALMERQRPFVTAPAAGPSPLQPASRSRPGASALGSAARPPRRSAGNTGSRASIVRLADGHGADQVWSQTLALLAGALDRALLAELAEGSGILGERDGVVTVEVADGARAGRLAAGYAGLVGRKLSEALRRPVRVRFVAPGWEPEPEPDRGTPRRTEPSAAIDPQTEPVPAPFIVAELGLASGAVWSAMLAELAAAGVGRGELDAWLRPGVLLGRGGDGGPGSPLIVGLPHDLARRRVAGRHLPALRAAAAALGLPPAIELVVTREWRAGHGEPEVGGGRSSGQIA